MEYGSYSYSTSNTIVNKMHSLSLRLIFPLLIVPNGVTQKLLDQRGSPQCTRQWQVALRRLLHVVDKFRCTKPALLTLHITVLRIPSDFLAEHLKVLLALPVLFLWKNQRMWRVTDGGGIFVRKDNMNCPARCHVNKRLSLSTYSKHVCVLMGLTFWTE